MIMQDGFEFFTRLADVVDEEYVALRQHVENLLQNMTVSDEIKAKIYKRLQQSKIKTAPMAWAFGGTFAQQIIGKGGSGTMVNVSSL